MLNFVALKKIYRINLPKIYRKKYPIMAILIRMHSQHSLLNHDFVVTPGEEGLIRPVCNAADVIDISEMLLLTLMKTSGNQFNRRIKNEQLCIVRSSPSIPTWQRVKKVKNYLTY